MLVIATLKLRTFDRGNILSCTLGPETRFFAEEQVEVLEIHSTVFHSMVFRYLVSEHRNVIKPQLITVFYA